MWYNAGDLISALFPHIGTIGTNLNLGRFRVTQKKSSLVFWMCITGWKTGQCDYSTSLTQNQRRVLLIIMGVLKWRVNDTLTMFDWKIFEKETI